MADCGRPVGVPVLSEPEDLEAWVEIWREHVFARQKAQMKLFIRTIGIARATTKIGMTNLVYNLSRYFWHEGRVASA